MSEVVQARTMFLPSGVDSATIVGVLAETPFLSSVPEGKLLELVRSSPLRQLAAGELVVEQGEFGHSMFILVRGALAVHARDDFGESVELARLETPGQYFGEAALLGHRRRSATVETVTPSLLIEFERTRIERLDMARGGEVLGALQHAIAPIYCRVDAQPFRRFVNLFFQNKK